jgi:hypothetical protein
MVFCSLVNVELSVGGRVWETFDRVGSACCACPWVMNPWKSVRFVGWANLEYHSATDLIVDKMSESYHSASANHRGSFSPSR